MTKPIVLTFVRHFLPGYKSGGPQASVLNLANALSDQFDFRIVTLDRDLGDETPYEGLQPGQWTNCEGHLVYYLSQNEGGFRGVGALLKNTEHDVLYLNGVFSAQTTIQPLLYRRFSKGPKTPTIVAPRGSFSKGALGLKAVKKKAYLAAASALGLYRDIMWQASTIDEQSDIQRVVGPSIEAVKIAKDLPSKVSPVLDRPARSVSTLRVVFISRISPMKNLDYLLDCLTQCQETVSLDIYGPIEDQSYWESCKAKIDRLPRWVTVTYRKALKPSEVASTFQNYDLFVLPTRGENFGHVIFESLANGTPVLISNRTPWADFPDGVGKILPLDNPAGFSDFIDQVAQQPQEALLNSNKAAHQYALELEQTNRDVVANADMFNAVLQNTSASSGRGRP